MIYRVGIIGCGNIFPMHAYPVNDLDCCKLVAVCDIKKDRANAYAKKFGCAAYYDYKMMIDNENLDVVHICTPHNDHPPQTLYALESGCHVLTEKPMSTKYEDTVAMVKTAERTGNTLGVIFQNRYNPGSVLAKKTLDNGELGKIIGVKMSVTWMRTDEYYSKSDWKGTWEKEGGGVMIDQAIHTMDLMRWLINSDVEYVKCHYENRTHKLIEVEDVADGVIMFKNGVMASFYTINYYSRDADVEIEIHCENGLINLSADSCVVSFNDGRKYIADKDPGESFNYGDVKSYWGVSHIKQISAFYGSLIRGEVPFIDGRDAMKTMRMVLALYDSGRKKEPVYFN